MNKYFGRFNGVGAAVRLSLGGIPRAVEIMALEDADLARIVWNDQMMCALEVSRGIVYFGSTNATQQYAQVVADLGIAPYYGGDIMTSANQTSVAYGGVIPYQRYVGNVDLKADKSVGVVSAINTWTLDTLANRTGHFNADLLRCVAGLGGAGTGKIGEGSKVVIRETGTGLVKTVGIEAGGNTAADAGGAADEVTLSEAVSSGTVQAIYGAFTFEAVPIGEKAGPGIVLDYYTYVNVAGELQAIVWEM